MTADVSVLELGDPRWQDLDRTDPTEPFCSSPYLAAVAAATSWRPILITVQAPAWSARYALLLRTLEEPEADRWLARTPDYGGPWLRCDDDAALAAVQLRAELDTVMRELGAVSEVILLSPWVPWRAEIATAFGCLAEKQVCLSGLDDLDRRWRDLAKGRRSDITRARRDLAVSWAPFDAAGANRFAARYANAMERLGADARWQLGARWFATLAETAGSAVWHAEAASEAGGAAGLFLTSGRRAAYLFASRWGDAPGSPSLVLWEGHLRLHQAGIDEMNLGGGVTPEDDDPLLRFKRGFATRSLPLLIGARVYDRETHEAAVAAGAARVLPDHAREPA